MHIKMVNGSKVLFVWDQVLPSAFHRYSLAFGSAITATVTILQPYADMRDMLFWQSTPVMFCGVVIAHSTFLALFSLAALLWPKGEVSMSLVAALSTLLWTPPADWVSYLAGGDLLDIHGLLEILPFNLIVTLTISQLYGCFLLPIIVSELSAEGAPTEESRIESALTEKTDTDLVHLEDQKEVDQRHTQSSHNPRVEIGGEFFLGDEIDYVMAQENYVVVYAHGKTTLLRDKISIVAERIPDRFGTLVHRSHWVAWTMIERVEKGNGQVNLILKLDNLVVPVARGRRREILSAVVSKIDQDIYFADTG